MTPEISEFSYGFALTNEIVGWMSLRAAPIFPSLVEEGKEGGGYDVKLDSPGVPLYLQFKRADCMTRRSAWEISKARTSLRTPFFRFPITQAGKSKQHALLLELDDGTNQVFYAAPRFHEFAEIDDAWARREVGKRSIFVRPAAIGTLDADSHHVAYDDTRAYLCSDPTLIPFQTFEALAASLRERVFALERPLREMIPAYRHSMTQAWERGKERAWGAHTVQHDALISAIKRPDVRQPPALGDYDDVRVPLEIREELRSLRQLAEDALRLFHSQLLIVQKQ